jgi:hypothetical protein
MYELMRFIEDMFKEYEFEVLSRDLLVKAQFAVDTFIDQNFSMIPKIHPDRYVTLSINSNNDGLNVTINPRFEKELEITNPEKLI